MVFDWFKWQTFKRQIDRFKEDAARIYGEKPYDLKEYKKKNWDEWYALQTPEIFAPNKLIRYEYVNGGKTCIYTTPHDYEHGEELQNLTKAYMVLPDHIKRVIPMHGLKIDGSLFEPSKIYVGKDGNTKIGAITRYLRILNILFYGKNSDVSFLDLYLQNYVKDEKKREECMRVAMSFNRQFTADYVKNGNYYEVQAMRNGMVIAYE